MDWRWPGRSVRTAGGAGAYCVTRAQLVFARMLFSRSQMPIGMETYRFQANPAIFCSNPYPDPRSLLYGVVRISGPYQRVVLEKPCVLSTILMGLRLSVSEI